MKKKNDIDQRHIGPVTLITVNKNAFSHWSTLINVTKYAIVEKNYVNQMTR